MDVGSMDDVQEEERVMSERFEGVPIVLTAPLTDTTRYDA
jgi:hypothetical protein